MDISEQRGNPPPLKVDDQTLLTEIQALEAQADEGAE